MCQSQSVDSVLLPLPPYIDRDDGADDEERYQTVFAKEMGAVAAPTAGLHFDDAMFQSLTDMGVEQAEVTLHVGAGTFQPVKTEKLDEHIMHSEWLSVSDETVEKMKAWKAGGGRVVAGGTISVHTKLKVPWGRSKA